MVGQGYDLPVPSLSGESFSIILLIGNRSLQGDIYILSFGVLVLGKGFLFDVDIIWLFLRGILVLL